MKGPDYPVYYTADVVYSTPSSHMAGGETLEEVTADVIRISSRCHAHGYKTLQVGPVKRYCRECHGTGKEAVRHKRTGHFLRNKVCSVCRGKGRPVVIVERFEAKASDDC